MGMKVVVPVWIRCYEYCNCIGVVFGCKSCPMEGFLGVIFLCGWAYPFPIHLYWNVVTVDPNTLSLGNGEDNCLIEVGHLTGDEKCECVIWNESIMCSRMAFGNVYWESLRGLFLGILYLYHWDSHATSFSNDYMGGSKLYG